ncbi:MAG: M20 family metallopeptidase [Patescibacteria group bacterium]|jgi:acetylornithine deacetylase/succinyl-diaminopimelate desuccinylase family protein
MDFKGKLKEEEILKLLKDLITIRSVNPMGNNLSGDEYTEGEIGKYIGEYLERLGIRVKLQKVSKNRNNVIGFLPGKNSYRSLLLETHMDTVPMGKNLLIPTVKEGKIYGRGSCDTKSSLAAMLVALKLIKENGVKQDANIYFIAVVDEEFCGLGLDKVIQSGFKATAGVVGEPTKLKIVTAHKGRLWFRIHTFGKSSHGSNPDKGGNAICMMNEVISLIRNKVEPYFATKKHKLLGSPTINIGKIYGGNAPNIIPDKCSIEVDCRLTPDEKPEDIIRKISTEIGRIRGKMPCFKAEIEKFFMVDTPPLVLGLNERIVKSMVKSSKRVLGKVNVCSVNYDTDAGKFTKAGIPCVVFGPGDIAQAHSDNEFVEIEQIVRASEVYAQIIVEF